MNLIKTAMDLTAKRPIIIILPAIFVLILIAFSIYNPILPVILGVSSVTGASVYDTVISIQQIIIDPSIFPIVTLLTIGLVLLISLLAGIIFSGYFHVVGIALRGVEKSEGDFISGIRKYFFKVFFITLRVSALLILITWVLSVAAVPAVVISRTAFSSKPGFITSAILIDALTAAVLLFSFMSARMYLLYWYPAALGNIKNPFRYSKKIVDRHFWRLMKGFILSDFIFALFLFVILITSSMALKFVLSWTFLTLFLSIMLIYVFKSFYSYADC